MILILMGPMGCGKTTIGKLLAGRLGWRFEDGDDFHPPGNVAKMQSGIPLDDSDREPWLDTLAEMISSCQTQGENLVLACSALKISYRNRLGIDQKNVVSVYLRGTYELLSRRLDSRQHPYMKKSLLASQLATLEEPEAGVKVDIDAPPADIVDNIVTIVFTSDTP